MKEFFSAFNIKEVFSAFLILFAIIDILGSTPIVLDLKSKGKTVSPLKSTMGAFILLIIFFVGSDAVLRFFNIDINSFAVAGAILLFLMALEMLLDIEIFKYNGPTAEASFVPLVFPLIAGAGALTTIISLKADYADINILLGLILNMICVYFVLASMDKLQKKIPPTALYMLRKFFGVMLLAIAIGMFTSNLTILVHAITHS